MLRHSPSSTQARLRVVLATVRDRQTAEDLVAEAFARARASWRRRQREFVVADVDVPVTETPAQPVLVPRKCP